jgi:uncharacterized membrane protein YcjF (UPF0283 family)
MEINNDQVERAGDRVFDNVDEALADRIISRSMENSREPERSVYNINTDKPKRRQRSIIKILIPAVLVLIALWVYVKSKSLKH